MAKNSGIKFKPKLDQSGIGEFKRSVDQLLKSIKDSKTLQIKNIELMKSAEASFKRSVNDMLKRVGSEVGVTIDNVKISDRAMSGIQNAVKNATSSLTKVDLSAVNKEIARMDAELTKMGQSIANKTNFIDAESIKQAEAEYQKLLVMMQAVKNMSGTDRQSGAATLSTQIALMQQLITYRSVEAEQERQRIALAQAADEATSQAYAKELDAARKQLEALSVSAKNIQFTDQTALTEYGKKWDEVAQAILRARELTGEDAAQAVTAIHAQITELQGLVNANNEAALAAKERAAAEQDAANAQNSILKSYESRLAKVGVGTKTSDLFAKDGLDGYISKIQEINDLISRAKTETGEAKQATMDQINAEIGALENAVAKRRAELEAAKEQAAADKEAARSAEARAKQIAGLEKTAIGLNGESALKTGNAEHIATYKAQYQELLDLIQQAKEAEAGDVGNILAQIREKINALVQLKTEYNNVASASKEASNAEAAAARLSNGVANTLNQLNSLKINNPGIYKTYKAEIDSMLLSLQTGAIDSESSLAAVRQRIKEIADESRNAGIAGKSFFQQMKAGWEKFGGWSLVTRSFTKVISTFKKAVTAVKEVDSAMTELRKVTDLTATAYEKFYDNATKMATNAGAKLSDTINAVADFSRLGYDISQATELAEASLVYMNIGDGLASIDEATASLISTMKAFGDETYSAMEIIDMFNEVGNRFAISSAGIGEALQRSAAALSTAGNSLEESIGLIVAANDVIQNPEVVGTALKTLSMYYRSAKTEAEEAGIATDGMAESTAKLRQELLALTGNQLDIQLNDHEFKSTYQVLKELSKIWEDIGEQSEINQARILEMLGGKRNANVLASIIKNFGDAEKAAATAADSTGSAWRENEKYLDSIEGKTKQLQASFETMANSIINSGLVKTFIDIAKAIADAVTWISKMGLMIPTLTTIVGIVKSIQTTLTATKATNTILDILGSAKGDTASKINSIKEVISGLGVFAKKLAGASIKSKIGDIGIGEDLANEMDGVIKGMENASLKTFSFTGALNKLKSIATGAGNVLKSFASTSIGKFTIGISAGIAIYKIAMNAWNNYINSLIEGANKIYDTHAEVSKAATSNKKSLEDMAEEFNTLKEGVNRYGENISLTDDEYERYLSLCSQIIEIVPEMKSAYNEKGSSLKTGYVDILDVAIQKQQELLDNDRQITATGSSKVLEGYKADVEKEAESLDDSVYKIIFHPGIDLDQYTKDAKRASQIWEEELAKIGAVNLFDIVGADNEKLNLEAVHKLAENYKNIISALADAGVPKEVLQKYEQLYNPLLEWNKKYNEDLAKLRETYKVAASYYESDLYKVVEDAGKLSVFEFGLGDIISLDKTDEENRKAAIDYLNSIVFAIYDVDDAMQRIENGEDIDRETLFEDLMEKYQKYPAIIDMVRTALFGASSAAKQNADDVGQTTKSYADLAKAMDDVTKAASFLEKARSGEKSSFDMLKEAQELVDAYNAILDEDMEGIDVGDLFETGEDGAIKWNIELIEQYAEEIIRAKFANSELAEENPELVDALVNEALSLDLVKKSALDLAEALSQVNNISDINDSINDYLSKGSEATAADKLAIITDVDEIIAKWNELGRARAELSEDGEEWVDITREDFFGESLDNMDLAKQKMAEYGEFILDVFSEGDPDNPLVAMLRSVMTTSNKATKEVYSLKDAVSSLKDVASKRFEGFDLTDVSGSIEEATNMANDWNDALKQIGRESEANKTWMDFLEIGDDGKLKEKADALRLMYEDVIDAVLSSIEGLTDEQKASMRQSMIDQFVSEQDAKNAEERAEKISDAFGEISSAFSYLEKHANGEKVGDGFYDALNEFYQLREKFGKEGEWSFSDFFEWDGEDFTYKTGVLKTAVTSMAEEIAQDLTDSMLQSDKITEDQVEETYKRIKDSIVNSMTEAKEEIDGLGDAISNAKSINSFLADVGAEDSNLLDLLASAEDLADKLGMDMGQIVKIDAMGKLTFDTEALVAQFNSYIDELVAAGQMSEDLGKQIKEAAAAEKELADNAKTAAERMADALSSMQSVAGNLNTALGGDSDILSMLGNADQMAKAWNDAFGDTFASQKDTFDFLLFDGDTVRENQKALKDMYSKLATDYIDNYVSMRKEAIEKARKAKEITEEDADDELAALETIRAELEAKLVPAFDAYIEQLERANELSKSADVSSTISEVYDYINAVNSGTMTFTDAYAKALSLMEKMPDAKLEDFFEIGEDGSINFANGIEMLTKWLKEYLATEVEAGHVSQEQADALVKEAEAAAKTASAYEALNNAISNVKSVSSYLEGAKAANSGTGTQNFVDMLQSALGLLEQMGEGYTLEDFFRFDPEGNIQYETDVLLNWSDKMIDNLVEQQKLSADFAEQLKLAARAEQQAATAAQRVSTAYNATKERASFGSGLARGGQLSYADYNAMMEANPKYAESIEYVNGVLTVNRDKYWEITEAMAEETAQMALLEAAQRKLKYEDLENQLKTRTDLTDDVRKSMQKEIDKLKLEAKGYMVLANEISNATNQFERFRAASANSEADTYMDAKTALKMIEDVLYNTESELYGQFQNESFQEAVKLLIDPQIDFTDPDWVNKVIGQLESDGSKIKKELDSWFGEGTDKNPQTTRGNMYSFWGDLVKGGFASEDIDEAGNKIGKLNGTVEDMANKFGVTKDAIRAALQQLEYWGVTKFNWEELDPEYFATLPEGIAKAAETAFNEAQAEADKLQAIADNLKKAAEEADKSGDSDTAKALEAQYEEAQKKADEAKKKADEAKTAAETAAQTATETEQTSTDKLKQSLEDVIAKVEELVSKPIELQLDGAITSTQTVIDNFTTIISLIEKLNTLNSGVWGGNGTGGSEGRTGGTTTTQKDVNVPIRMIASAGISDTKGNSLSKGDGTLDVEKLAAQYIPEGYDGNVDLTRRVIVPIAAMAEVGWKGYDEEGREVDLTTEGGWATLFSSTFTAGDMNNPINELEYDQQVVINATPIMADGTPLSPEAFKSYIQQILDESNGTGKTIEEVDSENLNLVLSVDVVQEGDSVEETIDDAVGWCQELHELQEEWDGIRFENNFFGEAESLDPNGVFDTLDESITTLESDLSSLQSTGADGVDVDTESGVTNVESLTGSVETAGDTISYVDGSDISVDTTAGQTNVGYLTSSVYELIAAIKTANSMTISPKTGSTGSSAPTGGTHAAAGTMSAKGGKTLVGELGREIVVDIDSGRWYTVGNNGPEFVNLPRRAIVFNHQKTAELLGKTSVDLSGIRGGLSMAGGTRGNSGVNGTINLEGLATPIKEAEKKVTGAIEQEEETLSDKLDAIKEAYDLANETLNHLIEHEEFNYYGAERAANYDKMHTYLANEVEIYKAIMKNSQEGIEALKAAGATDGDEQLQELEEAYWSAYRSMYEVLDNIRDLYTSALSDEVDNIQNAFKNLTDAAKEYNSTGKISIDTFQALLDGGVQYLGLLQDENGEFNVSETSVRNLLKMRKDQLAIETAIAYVDRIREALRNGEVNKVDELANATGQIGRSTWSLVYAQLELARAEGLTNEQYQAALTNLQNLQKLAAVAMDDFDSEDKIAEAKENFEALKKEIEHYIKHQEFSFDVSERAMDFKGMNKALDNEVAYYKQIMADAQATIAEMTREGADDTNENLQAVEEAYWSAYRSMYDTIDKIRALRVDALTDRLNGLTSAFSTLKQASDEYNKAGGISLDTFESLLSQGFEYMSLLDEENGKYVIAKDRISQYVQMRKNQLAIESALSYISKVREALENNEEERLQNLLKVQDMVSGSTWSMVYAQAALLKTQGLSNEQYETLIANLKKMQTLADSVVDTIASGEEDITEEYDKQKDAMSDILSYTEDLIRAETKERMDAIKDQIDAYKEIIDLKKKSLDETKNENEYQDSVAEKVKAIAELQAKADLLSLDTSRNAAVERQKLLDQIAEKQKELGKYQGDHALDAQKDALDAEYDAYEETRQAEIDELEKTISSEEKVYQLAIARIRDQWDTLYQDLIAWNTESGSVINQEITDAWEAATAAVQKYGSAVSALQEFTGNKPANYVVADIKKYHSGGIVGDEGSINDHEVVAILEKDELVVTKPMKKALYTAIDFVKSLGERLGTNVDKIRNFSVEGLRGQMMPAFAGASAAPVSQNNQINFSPNISVEFNGVDINGRDAASFGRDIANAAADNLFEAFTRRGIDAIRTLRQ